ncbi:MAG: tRNA pseudouridine(13) synthase TruD [Candidatus Methanomethylicaceae archaeon]
MNENISCMHYFDMSKLYYFSKKPGIGGKIKATPEDFIVEEITTDGSVLSIDKIFSRKDEEGSFTHFILQKRSWTTEGALRRIGDALGVGKKRFSYAGSKDKNAFTTQLVSAYKVAKEDLLSLKLKDIKILGAWYAKDKVHLGELLGNRFTIRVVDVKEKEPSKKIKKIANEIKMHFPNYFGPQRFGSSRKNTDTVGEFLIRGRPDLAVMEFLTGSCELEEREEAKVARLNLSKTNDFSLALKEFPKSLKLERSILYHLSKYPRDYAGALRCLPRQTLLLFVHAFQSRLFNILLSERIKEGEIKKEEGEYYCGEKLGFPDINKKEEKKRKSTYLVGKIIGYETKINEREKNLLLRFGIKPQDFKISFIPEISTKGGYRLLFAPLKDFSFKDNTFIFSLPAGSYATVALREFLDVNKEVV